MIYNDDCIKVMKRLESNTIDLIFADPPYFLSNNGKSISNGKIVSVNKGNWDKKENYIDVEKFTHDWLSETYRILKHTGSIFISGTMHNIFDIKNILSKIGYKIVNLLVWHKDDPPPLIYKNKLQFSHELLIWAKKGPNHVFNYGYAFELENKELQDVWRLPAVSKKEKQFGYHPTQKPECLLERIILCCSKSNQIVLDPFMGSGTTCVVAKRNNREYIGIEKEPSFFEYAKKRIDNTKAIFIKNEKDL